MTTGGQPNEFSVWDLISIGINLDVLSRVTARTPAHTSRPEQPGIIDRLQMLQSDLERLELSDSERLFRNEIGHILPLISSGSDCLGPAAGKIRKAVRKLRTVLVDEGMRRKTFVVLRSRAGEIERLLANPLLFFDIAESRLSNTQTEDFLSLLDAIH